MKDSAGFISNYCLWSLLRSVHWRLYNDVNKFNSRIIKRSCIPSATICYRNWMQFLQKDLSKKKTHLNLTRSLNNLPERERDRPWHKKDSRRAWNIGNDSQKLGIYSTKLQRSLLGSGKSLYFPQKSNRTRKTLTSFPIGTLLPNAVRSPILKVGKKMFQKIWHVVFPSRSYKSNCQTILYKAIIRTLTTLAINVLIDK